MKRESGKNGEGKINRWEKGGLAIFVSGPLGTMAVLGGRAPEPTLGVWAEL